MCAKKTKVQRKRTVSVSSSSSSNNNDDDDHDARDHKKRDSERTDSPSSSMPPADGNKISPNKKSKKAANNPMEASPAATLDQGDTAQWTPWKNTAYTTPKRWKNLKQLIHQESSKVAYRPSDTTKRSIHLGQYMEYEAPPSLLPKRKYSDLTGLVAKYTDPGTKLHYYDWREYQVLKEICTEAYQHQLLALRQAQVGIQ